ncbi:MAG: hypothetical protein KF686_03535 [Ramlibacter sp.]|nr:hypothetical protein [Ramlibacter sp.]
MTQDKDFQELQGRVVALQYVVQLIAYRLPVQQAGEVLGEMRSQRELSVSNLLATNLGDAAQESLFGVLDVVQKTLEDSLRSRGIQV